MILHCAQVAKIDHWHEHHARIVDSMRTRMELTAHEKDLDPGDAEVIELVYMRFRTDLDKVGYFSCEEDDATHVRVTIEREAR